jgi:hypothetical protein
MNAAEVNVDDFAQAIKEVLPVGHR